MTKTREEQRKEKRHYWQTQMKAWERSGKSQSAHCRDNQLNLKTFAYWRRKLKSDSGSVTLVQLPSATATIKQGASPTALRLLVCNRFAIEVDDGFNAATLSQLVKVVQGL
jgi:hypothetical protein